MARIAGVDLPRHKHIAYSLPYLYGIGRALVTGWAMPLPGRRVEIRETHEQRAYSEREIVESLGDAGLVPVEILDFDPYNEADSLEASGVKLFFVCRAS